MPHSKTINFFILVVIAILCVLLFWRSCSGSKESLPSEKIKERIVLLKSKAEKQKDTIIYKDRIRVKEVHHWHEVRHDSLIPCETKLLVADTVIQADSSLIFAQKIFIGLQCEIIAGQDTIIMGLHKAIKKSRRKGYLKGFFHGFVVGNIMGGAVVSSLR